MTHFTIAIVVPHDIQDIDAFITEQMAPFDESLKVKPYVSYSIVKAATELHDTMHRFERIISRNDPNYNIEKCREEIERLRQTTPEQRYQEYLKYHDRFNHAGEPISTYNPDSKWDWYVVGGRWDGWINDRKASGERIDANMATTEQAIERHKIPHAIITPDGQWHEHGEMGWWGIMLTENEQWDTEALKLFALYPGHQVVIIDAHI